MDLLEEKENQELQKIKEFDRESIRYFSNECKDFRERKIVKAFLRVIGVDFEGEDVVSYCSDPPDVIFRGARFEVVEILDKGRARHQEYKQKAKKSEAAKSFKDLEEPYTVSEPIDVLELSNLIEKNQAIDKKVAGYNRRCIDVHSIDLLIYLVLKHRQLKPPNQVVWPPKFLAKLEGQGWRSISFIMGFCAGVIFTGEDAPDFVKNLKGRIIFVEDAQVACSLWED